MTQTLKERVKVQKQNTLCGQDDHQVKRWGCTWVLKSGLKWKFQLWAELSLKATSTFPPSFFFYGGRSLWKTGSEFLPVKKLSFCLGCTALVGKEKRVCNAKTTNHQWSRNHHVVVWSTCVDLLCLLFFLCVAKEFSLPTTKSTHNKEDKEEDDSRYFDYFFP